MSIFNTDCICIICFEKEKHDKDYDAAVKAEREQIRKGNYNFEGIRVANKWRHYGQVEEIQSALSEVEFFDKLMGVSA